MTAAVVEASTRDLDAERYASVTAVDRWASDRAAKAWDALSFSGGRGTQAEFERVVLPVLLQTTVHAQTQAAELGGRYIDSVAEHLGVSAGPRPVAARFAGIGANGQDIATSFAQPLISAYQALANGADPAEVRAVSQRAIDRIMTTHVHDAARQAEWVAITANDEFTGHTRVVEPGACPRCLVLAGRFYRWSTGFRRHPRCRCSMRPSAEKRTQSPKAQLAAERAGLAEAAAEGAPTDRRWYAADGKGVMRPVVSDRPLPGEVIRKAGRNRETAIADLIRAGYLADPAAVSATGAKMTRRAPRKLPEDVLDYNTRELRKVSDDELADALTRAFDKDHPNADRIAAELDRREDAPLKAEQRKAVRAAAAREKRSADKEAQWSEVQRRIENGEDPREAVADVTGVSVEKQLRTELFHRLNSEGTVGKTLDEMIRYKFKQEIARQYVDAENETRGHLLTRQGEARGIDPANLFHGPEVRARKWASDELKEYWDANGRITLESYREQLLTGTATARRVDDFLT